MNAITIVSQALKYFIPSFCSLVYWVLVFGSKGKRRTLAIMAASWVIGFGLPCLIIAAYGYEDSKPILASLMFFNNLLIFGISRDSFLKTCFLDLSQSNIIVWAQIELGTLRRVLAVSYPLHVLVVIAVNACLLWFSVRYVTKPMRFMADSIRTGWVSLLAVPTCTLLTLTSSSMYLSLPGTDNPLHLLIFTTIVELGFVLYEIGLYRNMRNISVLEREKARQRLLESELAAYDESLATAKQVRHDLHHHNTVVLEYLSSGDLEGAQKYLRGYDEFLNQTALPEFCKNKTANAVLRLYARQADANQIPFSVTASIGEQISLPEPDLATILSNLLENALRAAQAAAQPTVSVRISESGTLRIEVRNTMVGTAVFSPDGLPLSARPDGGVGTQSVRRIVTRYGGMLRFQQDENEFFAQVILGA